MIVFAGGGQGRGMGPRFFLTLIGVVAVSGCTLELSLGSLGSARSPGLGDGGTFSGNGTTSGSSQGQGELGPGPDGMWGTPDDDLGGGSTGSSTIPPVPVQGTCTGFTSPQDVVALPGLELGAFAVEGAGVYVGSRRAGSPPTPGPLYRTSTVGGATAVTLTDDAYLAGPVRVGGGRVAFPKMSVVPVGSTYELHPVAVETVEISGTNRETVPNYGGHTELRGLTVTWGADVLWVAFGGGTDTLVRWSNATKLTMALAEGPELQDPIVVAGDVVYTTFESGVTTLHRVPLTGGSPTTVAAIGAAVDGRVKLLGSDGSSVFFETQRQMERIAATGGVRSLVVQGHRHGAPVVVDGASVYWISDLDPSEIMTSTVSGSFVGVAVPMGGAEVTSLAVDDCNLYWTAGNPSHLLARKK